jgi:ATP-dependent metalloprotease FtsH
MDGKGRRASSGLDRRARQSRIVRYTRKSVQFIVTNRQAFLAGGLVITLVVLLFGVFSYFQGPVISSANSSETTVDYSAFVAQVKSGNMLAVTVRGSDLHGLLIRSLAQSVSGAVAQPAYTASQRASDLIAFSRYLSTNSNWASTPQGPAIDPSRLVYAHVPGTGDPSLMPLLVDNHVVVTIQPPAQPSVLLSLFWRLLPFIFLVLAMLFFLTPRNPRRAAGGTDEQFQQMGKSKVRRYEQGNEMKESKKSKNDPSFNMLKPTSQAPDAVNKNGAAAARRRLEPPVTFADVAGIDEVRQELEEIVQFLRSAERYERLGARIPRGALLVGPPGTGKTLLAKAVAGEAGVPFFSISASEFVEMFVGVGASRVRDLFKQARQAAPCVVFIDEIDAVGRKRNVKVMGNDERDQTLNQLLVELDGFTSRDAIVVMAATNRVDILDKALLRPGRFDRHITVSMPDRAGREAILRVHTRRVPLEDEVSLERLSRLTTGMSGADLANLVNEAALGAARRNLEKVDHECFEDALARVQLGALRPIVMSETERRIIAYHEGGHALVAYHLPEADTVNRVTILPRGQSLGVTQFTAEEDRYNYSRHVLMTRIAVGLGGRASEELIFGPEHVTTGAENDLQVVTNIARNMVTRWGMSEQVGVVFADYRTDALGAGLNMRRVDVDDLAPQNRTLVAGSDGRLMLNGPERYGQSANQYAFAMQVPASPRASSVSMAATIDAEVLRILAEGYAMARAILQEHHAQLDKLAATLMEREQLDRKQFEALFEE